MTKLTETPVATDLNLTDHQKKVISKIVAAPTDKVAGEEISKDEKLVAARDMLVNLGVITFDNNRAALTEKGMQLAKDDNLIDETGQLTETGKKYAYDEGSEQPAEEFGGVPDLNFGESISMIREMNRLVEGIDLTKKPTNAEVEKFFSYYPDITDVEDFGSLYNEEFSDRFTDKEVDTQVLDEYLSRAWYWYKHQEWPAADWKWWVS